MTMPLETTPWEVTDGMTTERCRLAFLLACIEDDPNDEAFIAMAVQDVLRSRARHGMTKHHPMTLKRLQKTLAIFPTVPLHAVAHVVETLGYGFDIASLDPASAPKRPIRAAAKRTSSATRIQRRPT